MIFSIRSIPTSIVTCVMKLFVSLQSGVSLGAVSIAVDSLGEYGAVNSLDSKINVWNMKDFSCVGDVIKMAPSECWDMAFVPRKHGSDPLVLAMAGGSANCLRLWNVLENKEISKFDIVSDSENKRREHFILSVAVSPDGRHIAGSGMDGIISIFDIASTELICQCKAHSKPIRKIAFTPDSKYIVSACDDMLVGVFEVATGNTVQIMSGHESWVLGLAIHPEGKILATGGSDGKVKLWDIENNKCIQTISEHSDQVWGVAWSHDGKRLASVSDDRAVIVYALL